MAEKGFKTIMLDAQTMDCLDYLKYITNEHKTVILRRVLRLMRKMGDNFLKGTEISIKIEEPNRVVIEFFGKCRRHFEVKDVSQNESKEVKEVELE